MANININLYDGWSAHTLPIHSYYSGKWESDHQVPKWKLTDDNRAVYSEGNNRPSLYCGLPSIGQRMEGKVKVASTSDDDYMGWSVGFTGTGDWDKDDASWYLIDWKRKFQELSGDWNKCGGGGKIQGKMGLKLSKITGKPRESELWSHKDEFLCQGGGVEEIDLTNEYSSTGWEANKEYSWAIAVENQNSFKFYIDEVEQFQYNSASLHAESKFCFYSFSQDKPMFYDVSYSSCHPGANGDPHFKTWKNEHFEYHGQCDLVLAKDPKFAEGLGMDVHVRTKLVRHWSYIKSAAIRIGNDILEIEGTSTEFDSETHYWINYEYQGDITTFAGFPVKTFAQKGTRTHKNRIEIDLDSVYPGRKIILSTLKEFVKVEFEGATKEVYGHTVGMLGDYATGKTLARDGITELHDFTEFGHEWQVNPSDGRLFHEASKPQFPDMCVDPENPRGDRRRLGASAITIEAAEEACASLPDKLDRKDCIYDVLATQDMDIVGAY
jgi:hypothetical protein